MSWFSRKPTQQKYVEAAVTVATNLYLHTIPEAEDAPVCLKFSLPDSRYRYLIFCLSAAITAALAYDEKKKIEPNTFINGCLHFAVWAATEYASEYFDDPTQSSSYADKAKDYLQEFLKHWSNWPSLEKDAKHAESIALISSMIRTTESTLSCALDDNQRLEPLALQINCRLPTMWRAFTELAKA